jgi:hypothetical protein
MNDLRSRVPEMQMIDIFSDGAASQFKQRFNFVNISFFPSLYGVETTWHFFATGHGKGAVDGIGGTIKRQVWRSVLSDAFVVSDAASFFTCAKSLSTSINVLYLSEDDINKHRDMLDIRWKNVISLPGTQSLHFIQAISPYKVVYKQYSTCEIVHQFLFQVNQSEQYPMDLSVVRSSTAGPSLTGPSPTGPLPTKPGKRSNRKAKCGLTRGLK